MKKQINETKEKLGRLKRAVSNDRLVSEVENDSDWFHILFRSVSMIITETWVPHRFGFDKIHRWSFPTNQGMGNIQRIHGFYHWVDHWGSAMKTLWSTHRGLFVVRFSYGWSMVKMHEKRNQPTFWSRINWTVRLGVREIRASDVQGYPVMWTCAAISNNLLIGTVFCLKFAYLLVFAWFDCGSLIPWFV